MDDVARLAGVSKPTVSRALANSPRVLPETKQRILAIAQAHGYTVNRNAQQLRGKRISTIAVVIDFPSLPDRRLSQAFHFELLGDVTNALAARDLDVLLCSPASQESYQTILSSRRADGFIFIGQGARDALFRALARTPAPFVVWGAASEGEPYCTVGSDNFRGGVLAGERFLELGRRRVLFVGSRSHPEFDARRRGLAEGLQAAAGEATINDIEPPDLSYEGSYRVMCAHLATASIVPDAIFAASDTMAMSVVAALRDGGLSVPGDVSVIGYDDAGPAAYFNPPLTTIRQDTRLGGALLAEKLIQRIEGVNPKAATLPTELIVRAT